MHPFLTIAQGPEVRNTALMSHLKHAPIRVVRCLL